MSHETHILLVEDEAPKRKHIATLVNELAPDARLSEARSVTSALKILEAEPVDLVLLDMSLPTFDVGDRERGGRPQGFGGIEVLRHMTMAEIFSPTVVITGYEGFMREDGLTADLSQLKIEWHSEFPALLHAVLHYSSSYDEWKVVLEGILDDVGIGKGES